MRFALTLAPLLAGLAIGGPAFADVILDDPLHGYCGGPGQCVDNGTNSPTSNNPPTNFGFTISRSSDGRFPARYSRSQQRRLHPTVSL
jgi:hypothetical protein